LLIYFSDKIFLAIKQFPIFHPLLTNVLEVSVCSSM